MTVGIKIFIRGILSPTSYPVRVYGINQFRLSRRLVFSKKVQHLGKWSFPNKRILRNNLCLPACKLLYLDKREKNFLLTDIISDIIIVRN